MPETSALFPTETKVERPRFRPRRWSRIASPSAPLCDSIAELLWLLRESGRTSDQVAAKGTFQHGMIGEGVAGLLRVALQPGVNLYPEISGSHHRFTIRFMQWPDALQRPTQATQDVRFLLTIC